MKILSIDTSSSICSVSILEDKEVIKEKENNDIKTHSQKLMPLIDELFNECNIKLKDIDLIACCVGPGSFTGVRIGVSTVKAFADVMNIPVIGVTSLEGLAYNVKKYGYICSLIDAKNNNVYFGLFEFENDQYKIINKLKADNINNIIDELKQYNNITFVGDGAAIYKDIIEKKLSNCKFVDSKFNEQTSVSIAHIARKLYENGENGTSENLIPIYLRKSQAERVLEGEK